MLPYCPDAPMEPPPEVHDNYANCCAVCGQAMPEGVLTFFMGGEAVCEDDLYDYVIEHAGPYEDDFIDDVKAWDYYSEWFNDRPDAEKLEVIKRHYKTFLINEFDKARIRKDRKNYCRESDEFYEYAKERMQ